MKGSSYASTFCVFVMAFICGLYGFYETCQIRLGGVANQTSPDLRQDLENTKRIRLYIDPTPDGNGQLVRDYPEIFETGAVVIIFGAPWCQWCKAEGKALTEPSREYNVIYAEIENPDGTDSRWGILMQKWNLGGSIPVTVVVEKGKVVKTFNGFTEWDTIKPFAEKAKKNERESKTDFIIGPLDGSKFGDIDVDNRRRNRNRQ